MSSPPHPGPRHPGQPHPGKPHPGGRPELDRLAHETLVAGAVLIVDDPDRPTVSLPVEPGACPCPAEPLLGVRCGPAVQAVAYPAAVVIHHDRSVTDEVIGIAVTRRGEVALADPHGALLDMPTVGSVSTDLGLRTFGLPTPPPADGLAAFVDALWLDAILDRVLTSDLGEPPRWRAISRLHPLGRAGTVASPEQLRAARADLPGGWESLRRSYVKSGQHGLFMSAALADWLDEGSFARRLLASVPDVDLVLDDLVELLRPREVSLVRAALQPPLEIR